MKNKDMAAGYKVQLEMTRNQRAAHFLSWAAEKHPFHFFSPSAVVKHCMGYARFPQERSKEVEDFSHASGQIRKLLFKNYEKGLISLPGQGIRCSVDDFDFTKNCISKTSKRLVSVQAQLAEQVAVVDVGTFPQNVDGKKWTTFIKSTNSAVKQLSDPAFIQKLLPPAKEEAKDEKK